MEWAEAYELRKRITKATEAGVLPSIVIEEIFSILGALIDDAEARHRQVDSLYDQVNNRDPGEE